MDSPYIFKIYPHMNALYDKLAYLQTDKGEKQRKR